jgi:hypothetical protein
MWAEIDAQPETQQLITASAWITYFQQTIVPTLASRRRRIVLELLRQRYDDGSPIWDATSIGETIGSGRNAIMRLAEEGRAVERRAEKPQREEDVDGPPPLPVD